MRKVRGGETGVKDTCEKDKNTGWECFNNPVGDVVRARGLIDFEVANDEGQFVQGDRITDEGVRLTEDVSDRGNGTDVLGRGGGFERSELLGVVIGKNLGNVGWGGDVSIVGIKNVGRNFQFLVIHLLNNFVERVVRGKEGGNERAPVGIGVLANGSADLGPVSVKKDVKERMVVVEPKTTDNVLLPDAVDNMAG